MREATDERGGEIITDGSQVWVETERQRGTCRARPTPPNVSYWATWATKVERMGLAEAARAHELVERAAVRGKIVLVVNEHT